MNSEKILNRNLNTIKIIQILVQAALQDYLKMMIIIIGK